MSTSPELDQAYEDAYIEACELVGPNAYDFDSISERIFDRLLIERGIEE